MSTTAIVKSRSMRRALQPNAIRKETFENIFAHDLTALPFELKEGGPNLSFNCYQAREEQAKARRKAKHCQGFSFLYPVIAVLRLVEKSALTAHEFRRFQCEFVAGLRAF